MDELLGTLPAHVTLLAVSKLHPAAKVRWLYQTYHVTHFGENYAQEALAKMAALADLPLIWHFIGRLQKNKAKGVVGAFELIHSVDSFELAELINRLAAERGIRQRILMQINLAGEATKGGFRPQDFSPDLLERLKKLSAISVDGLMTMPPLSASADEARPYFRDLRKLLQTHCQVLPTLRVLSMGTSGDFRVAIEEGATMVRLGTVLFGPREPLSRSVGQ
ncbi:MAG: YggS family pyridoxal phosphate-dependent enzyme [Bdellovibrio sp.]|nr:MAG: YggS family pyridoxal phosphate-dependent enzyme [Bdellovibrio sp.]